MKTTVDIIKQGILNEIEGYEFYRMAGDKIENGENRDIFYEISKEEKKHAQWLQNVYKQLTKSEILDMAFLENPPSPEIYNWSKLNIDMTNTAVSVFGIAVQMEKDSVDFYENAMQDVEDEKLKKLYQTLINWEKMHLEQFLNQYNIYKEMWWSSQEFAPF